MPTHPQSLRAGSSIAQVWLDGGVGGVGGAGGGVGVGGVGGGFGVGGGVGGDGGSGDESGQKVTFTPLKAGLSHFIPTLPAIMVGNGNPVCAMNMHLWSPS